MFNYTKVVEVVTYFCVSVVIPIPVLGSLFSPVEAQTSATSDEEQASIEKLENRINSLEGKIEIFEPTIKWAFGSAVGLYALVASLNFLKTFILDKQERRQIEFDLKEGLETILKEEVVPVAIKPFQDELRKLQEDLVTIRSSMRLLAYRTNMLSADLAVSTSIYQYPLALHEYVSAIEVLCQELDLMPATSSLGKTEVSLVVAYSLERLSQLAFELETLTKEDKIQDFVPRLSKAQAIEINQILNKISVEGFGHSRRRELTTLIESLSTHN